MATPHIVQAHQETVHITIVRWRPTHAPRKGDPHYGIFNRTRAHMKATGKLVCWVCGATTDVQLHHHLVEYCLANAIDLDKFHHLWPALHAETPEQLLELLESEPCLLALCRLHHVGEKGIHWLPYPDWLGDAGEKAGLPDLARALLGKDNKGTEGTESL